MRAQVAAARAAYEGAGAGQEAQRDAQDYQRDVPAGAGDADIRMGGDDAAGDGAVEEPRADNGEPAYMDLGNVEKKPRTNPRSFRYNFSQRNRKWHEDNDLNWKYIGSGVCRRVFPNAKSMILTTKTGPAACDITTRTIRCAVTGRVVDKCYVQGTPDRLLRR